MITKGQYNDWKNHPVTKAYFDSLKEAKEHFELELVYGHNIESHAKMAQSVGIMRAYDSAIAYLPVFDEEGYMIDEEGKIIE